MIVDLQRIKISLNLKLREDISKIKSFMCCFLAAVKEIILLRKINEEANNRCATGVQ